MSMLPHDILKDAHDLVDTADTASLCSRALLEVRLDSLTDGLPAELTVLLTELHGYQIAMRAMAHNIKAMVGSANMVGMIDAPKPLELPLMPAATPRITTSRPSRYEGRMVGKAAAAGPD